MEYKWEDLPERKNLFTIKNTVMRNLNTGKAVGHYSTNTKIAVVQKCVTPEKTYYRTAEAVYHYLNYAFEAEDFGLPNEKAPSAPSNGSYHLNNSTEDSSPKSRTLILAGKQTPSKQPGFSKDGERNRVKNWLKRIFRRAHGNTKNS